MKLYGVKCWFTDCNDALAQDVSYSLFTSVGLAEAHAKKLSADNALDDFPRREAEYVVIEFQLYGKIEQ